MKRLLPALIISLLFPSLTTAQTSPPPIDGLDWMRVGMARYVSNQPFGWTYEQMRRQMETFFRLSSIDGDKVSPQSTARLAALDRAQTRATRIGMLLAADLNNDDRVARDEYRLLVTHRLGFAAMIASNRATNFEREIDSAFEDDENHDGIIDLAEMKAGADRRNPRSFSVTIFGEMTVPLSLDADNDGFVEKAEYEAAIRTIFGEIDVDNSGDVSEEEIKNWQPRLQAAREIISKAQRAAAMAAENAARGRLCGFPTPPKDAAIAFVGAYEGQGVSTVSIDGDDVETSVSDVLIEPGDKPLYVVLSSYDAMVWRFTGAVNRVARVVATSSKGNKANAPRVGVVGVPKAKVSFTTRTNCLRYDGDKNDGGPAALAATLGREVDVSAVTYGLALASLPSGKVSNNATFANAREAPKDSPAAAMWEEMRRFSPGGVIEIDPRSVVSNLPAAKYQVLPQQAGLAQLIEEGALTPTATAKALEIENGDIKRSTVIRGLRINRQITFPAGLNGAHSVNFVLGRGVPKPNGSPGHSCVMSEDDPAQTTGPRHCR